MQKKGIWLGELFNFCDYLSMKSIMCICIIRLVKEVSGRD